MASGTRQEQRSRNTRALIERTSRRLFARKGYAATSTAEILERSGLSRGAVYHHYDSKQEIFTAVFERLQAEVAEAVLRAVEAGRRPDRRLRAACDAFLDACLDREVRQIVLIDAPSVVPWEAWHEIQARHTLAVLEGVIEDAVNAGDIARQPAEPLASVLLGTLNAAALSMARAPGSGTERARIGKTVYRLLDGLHR